MDNWIFLFLGLILAYLLEFTRPWVKSLYERSLLSSRKVQIEALKRLYSYQKRLSQHPEFIAIQAILNLTMALVFIAAFATIFSLMYFLWDGLPIGLLIVSVGLASISLLIQTWGTNKALMNLDIDSFRKEAIRIIEKLGGNPEELDKEEAE